MKNILGIIASALILSFNSTAQERHTVLSVTQEMHENSWFIEQQKLWGADVKADKTNAEAWYNYYNATRALKILSEDKSTKDNYLKQCTEIAENAYAAIPNTFEANHLMWKDCNNDEAKEKYLLDAARISPNDSRAYDDLMVYYEIKRDKENFNEMCMKLYMNRELPSSLMNWGYNVLSELEPNAIVFVHGDNDTYALWLTQSVKEFRPDVIIVNTSMMRMDEYRERILSELNYPVFSGEYDDLFEFMIENRKDRSFQVSGSAIYGFKDSPIMDSLYLVGLTYLYCDYQFDNVSIIRRNYEKRYLIDYLTEQFSVHPSQDIAGMFDAIYIPSMIKLYKHYCDSEETAKMKKIGALLLKISKKTGQEDQVKKLIKDC
jgi:hypothetical protein